MNTLKVLTIATAVVLASFANVQAESVKTVAGTLQISSDMQMTALSRSEVGKLILNSGSARGTRLNTNKMENMLYKELGSSMDVYQLRGSDRTGLKTASIFILAKDISGGAIPKGMANTMTPDNPVMQMAIQNINMNAGNLEQILNEKIRESLSKQKAGTNYDVQVTLEDIEPITALPGAGGIYYWAGTRAVISVNGFALPFYISGAVLPQAKTPTTILMITSDVERNYFIPRLKAIVASIQ